MTFFRTHLPAWAAVCLALAALAGPARSRGSDVSVVQSDPSGVVLRYQVPAAAFAPDTVDGHAYVKPGIAGAVTLGLPGNPALPIRTAWVAVPYGAEVSLSVEAAGVARSVQGVPSPQAGAAPRVRGASADAIQRKPDRKAYTSMSFAPGVLGRITGYYNLRNQRLARVEFYPLQASTGLSQMRAYTELTARVTWKGGTLGAPAERDDPFESIYRRQVLNYEAGRTFRRPASVRIENPVDGREFFSSSTGPWLRMRLTRRGLYAVTLADLQTAGLSPSEIGSIDASTVRVFTHSTGGPPIPETEDCDTCFMREVQCEVRGADGGAIEGAHSFVVGDRVVFYGTATEGFPEEFAADTTTSDSTEYYRNQYTNENVYWLTWGAGSRFANAPRRMPRTPAATNTGGAPTFDRVRARVHLEKDVDWAPDLVDQSEVLSKWEKWFWESYSSTAPGYLLPAPAFSLPQADSTHDGRLLVRMWGDEEGYDHLGRVSFRGSVIAETIWYYRSAANLVGTFKPTPTDNQFIYSIPQGRSDEQRLAYLEVRYTRFLGPDNGALFFRAAQPSGEQHYQLAGWSADREVYSVHDFGTVERITGGGANTFGDAPGGQTAYLVVEPSAILHPTKIERAPFQGSSFAYLHDTRRGADDVIVTYDGFKSYADELKAWRDNHLFGIASPRVTVTGVQQVYDEFSGGRFEPTAIRNMGRFLYRYWQSPALTYMTFLGDASEDFKDISRLSPNGDGITNFVPTYENSVDDIYPQSQYSTDDWYARTDYGQGLDFCTGRLPASTPEQARLLVRDKTIAYEKDPEYGTWRTRYLLSADDQFLCTVPDPIGFVHTQQAEDQAENYVPPELDVQKVYLLEYGYGVTGDLCRKPKAEDDFVRGMNEGALIATFIGHGNPDQVANEKVFSNSDLGSLNNGRRLWVFMMASCTVGKVDDHVRNGLAESVMKLRGGGAVAALAATQKAIANESVPLDNSIVHFLFDRSDNSFAHPLGLAVLEGKLENIFYGYGVNGEKYVLQGDPALLIAAPNYRIGFDSPPTTVEQGQLVNLSYTLYSNWDTTLAPAEVSDFTGIDSVEVLEPPTLKEFNFGNSAYYPSLPNDYLLPAGTIFRGTGTIHNGRGTVRFYMPAGARRGPNMEVRVYGMGQRGGVARDAVGRVSLTTISGAAVPDSGGPALTLELTGDVNAVRAGDVLRITARSPYGIYLGQKPLNSIYISIDGRGRTLLNDRFTYRPDSFTVGTVDFPLPALEPGQHSIVVSAATNLATDLDGGRNRSSASLTLTAAGGPPVELQNVFNYPNPVRAGETDLFFEIRDPGQAKVDIYTVAGSRIRTLTASVPGGQSRLHWDMKDSDADVVPNGTYVFRVEVAQAGGRKASAYGKIVVLRN